MRHSIGVMLLLAVLTVGWVGPATAAPLADTAGANFTQADLAGTWYFQVRGDAPSGNDPGWTSASVTVNTTGVVTGGTFVTDTGSTGTFTGGAFTIDGTGQVTGSLIVSDGHTESFPRGKLDAGKTFLALVNSSPENRALVVAIKAGGSFTQADLAGTWYFQLFGDSPSGNHPNWTSASVTVNTTGGVTGGTWVTDTGDTGTFTGGAITIDSTGQVTGSLITSNGHTVSFPHGKLDAGKTFLALVNSSPENRALVVAIKAGGSFTQADLAGTWYFLDYADYLSANDPGWLFGTLTVDATGAVTGGGGIDNSWGYPMMSCTGGAFTIDSAGQVSGSLTCGSRTSSFPHGKLNAGKSVLTLVESQPDWRSLGLLIKAGTTPSVFPLTVAKTGTGSGKVTSAPAGIDCGSTCSASFPQGAAVTLTAAAVSGSGFTGWSGTGISCPGTGPCSVTMNQARTVTASFALTSYILSVTVGGNSSGSVTFSPGGIICTGTCAANYPTGTLVTLTASAGAGGVFRGWGGACAGSSNPCQVTMTAAKTVTATFTQKVTVAATDPTATEAGLTPGTFTFTRTGTAAALASALTVSYTVTGTATAGSDYVALGTSVTFPAGAATVTKTVTPLQDALQELNETVLLTLTPSPNYAVGAPSSATVTLTSDEAVTRTVTVRATDALATEAGLTPGNFTFTRTGSTAATLTVYYSVTGTATAGSDYLFLGTSVVFPAGATTVTKTVTPLQDALQELPETVILTLVQNPNYAVGSPGSATVTLTSDEAVTQTVTVRATDALATEAGLTPGTFTFTRTGSTAASLTVAFTVAGTATAGVDYVILGTSVVFPAGAATVTKTVTPLQDVLQELNETVVLTLTPSPNYAVGSPGSATVAIVSEESVTQTVTVRATDALATEAGLTPGTFTFTRTGSTAAALTVAFTVAGTATAGGDYVALGTSAIFPAGAATVTKTVTPLQDALQELNETVVLTLTQSPNYAVGTPSSATVTLTSEEPVTQTVTVAATDNLATEAGPTTGTFTFTRTGSPAAALTVYYSVTGTATAGSDYVALGTSVVFPAGAATVTKTVTPLQDTLMELPETVSVTLRQYSTYAVGYASTATITLTSDEFVTRAVFVTATDASASEAGLTTGTFRFIRTGSLTNALTVYYTVGGSATAGTDYVSLGTAVTFPVGASTLTKAVTPLQDTLQELNETVIVTLTQHSAYAVGSPSSATVTLASEDVDGCARTPIILGHSVTGTLTDSDCGARGHPSIKADLYTFVGSAGQLVTLAMTAGFDAYLILMDPSANAIAQDDDGGGGTNSRISLTLPTTGLYTIQASAFDSTGRGAYTLSTSIAATVTVTASGPTATEAGLTPGAFRFSRTGSLTGALTVGYTVTGTATAGSDYASLGTSVTFPAGQGAVTKTVTPLQDALVEGNETVVLTLTPSTLYTVGSQSTATVTLSSEDAAVPNMLGTYTGSGSQTLAACEDPASNISVSFGATIRITSQTGSSFSGSGVLTATVSGTPYASTLSNLRGSVNAAGQLSGGTYSFVTTAAGSFDSSGTGTFTGTLVGNRITVTFVSHDQVGDTCVVTGSLAATR